MASNQFDQHGPDPALLQAYSKNAFELSASTPRTLRSQLGVDFQPSEYSVICGRGKASYDHTGNHRLRNVHSMFVEKYALTGCKKQKSTISAHIVAMTRQSGGVFCKYEQGAWFEVGDHFARDKVSAMFRDTLHTEYKSSALAKSARRRARTKRNKTQAQQYSQQLIDGSMHWDAVSHCPDASSMSSSSSGSSTDSLGFDSSLEIECFDIDVFQD